MKKRESFFLFLFIVFMSLNSFVFSVIIEDFNIKDGFEKNSDDTATVELYLSTAGYENKSVRMYYDLTTGNWAQMYKDYSVQNWSGGDTLKFWFYGSGATNNLEIKLSDDDGSIFIKTLPNVTNNNSWTKAEIPLTDFSYGWGGNNTLDKTKIKKISFGVTKSEGSNGFLIIDNVTLYLSTPVVKVLDNFDDLNSTNNFGGTNVTWGSTCTIAYVSTQTYEGAGAAEISYDVSSGGYAGFILPLNSENVSNTTHISFYVKGLTGNEKILIKFENDYGWNSEKNMSDYVDLSNNWQKVEIPLSDFVDSTYGNFLSTSTVTMKLNIVFGKPLGTPYNSKIYIDEIKFLVPGVAGTEVKIIDSMDDLAGQLSSWNKVGDAVKSLQSVDGYNKSAIKINYDFTSANDTWALIERNLNLNFSYYTHLLLRYKGDFNKNNLEIKLTDSDETTYWKKIFNVSSVSSWNTIKIPIKEFSYFARDLLKSDMNLNLKEITKVWLVVSKGSSVSGENKGSIYFDELELLQESEFQTKSGNIEVFEVKNNPFSPNNDGLKDKAYFIYKLKDFANVKLEIYNLRGELVKTFDEGEKQPNQEFIIEWDGKDVDNKLLKNGLYIYRFVIKLLDGKQEEIKHIVGIVK